MSRKGIGIRTNVTKEEIAQMREMRKKGEKIEVIAATLNRSHSVVSKYTDDLDPLKELHNEIRRLNDVVNGQRDVIKAQTDTIAKLRAQLPSSTSKGL